MRKIWAFGGIPGTGKTTLMNRIINGFATDWKVGTPAPLCNGIYSESLDTWVLGKYAPFYELEGYAQGTDKLSMAVQPEAIKFVKETESNIIFEGDRLFTASFLEECEAQNVDFKIFILTADNIQERYEQRGSTQSEKFIQGRKTKVDNIAKNFLLWDYIVEYKHNVESDTTFIVNELRKSI